VGVKSRQVKDEEGVGGKMPRRKMVRVDELTISVWQAASAAVQCMMLQYYRVKKQY